MESTIRKFELEIIKDDAEFYLFLIQLLLSHKSSGVLIFGLIPYLSLFTVETHKYFQNVIPSYAQSLSTTYGKIIESSRMRVKFFDDTEKRTDGIFELLNWILQFQREWMINQHKGCLAPVKKALQDDLGIFVYNEHIIGSTHTGLLSLGYSKEDLPTISNEIPKVIMSLSNSVAEDLGSYLGKLCTFPEFKPNTSNTNLVAYALDDSNLGYKDEKSLKYFESVFNDSGTVEINFSLLVFLSAINFLQYILNYLVSDSSCVLFKLKFVTLYHLASSIEKLQNYGYPRNLLTQRSKDYFRAILDNKALKQIKEESKFRNILVHYKITEVPETVLSPSIGLYGLAEYFFNGKTYDELNQEVNDQLERISKIMEEWLNWQLNPSQISRW